MQKAAALTILFSAAVSIPLNPKFPFFVSQSSLFFQYLDLLFFYLSFLFLYLRSLFLLNKNFSSFFIQDQFRSFSRASHKLRQG